eukprot:Tbor_TRINITY_DN5840_c0_g3::TRINITY_DN5840_c0_g3_i1::g.5973::m.5973
MAATLTSNLILQKTKLNSLEHVKKLNSCGVQVSNINIIRETYNIEVLSLSVNCIQDLSAISECRNLRELFLRKNHIHDIKQVLHLSQLRYLVNLGLSENPICEDAAYRMFVIAAIPSLQKLDDIDISRNERANAEKTFPGLSRMPPPPPLTEAEIEQGALRAILPSKASSPPSRHYNRNTSVSEPPSAVGGHINRSQNYDNDNVSESIPSTSNSKPQYNAHEYQHHHQQHHRQYPTQEHIDHRPREIHRDPLVRRSPVPRAKNPPPNPYDERPPNYHTTVSSSSSAGGYQHHYHQQTHGQRYVEQRNSFGNGGSGGNRSPQIQAQNSRHNSYNQKMSSSSSTRREDNVIQAIKLLMNQLSPFGLEEATHHARELLRKSHVL